MTTTSAIAGVDHLSPRLPAVLLAGMLAITGCSTRTVSPSPSLPADPMASPLALTCLTCHSGPDPERNAIDLSALATTTIAHRLRDYRASRRPGTVMPRLAAALTDAEIDRLAAELGATPP